MMGRILCWMGFHSWKYGIELTDTPEALEVLLVRYCPRCEALEQVPPHMIDDSRREVEL